MFQIVVSYVGVLCVGRIDFKRLLLLFELLDEGIKLTLHLVDLFLLFFDGKVTSFKLRVQIVKILERVLPLLIWLTI